MRPTGSRRAAAHRQRSGGRAAARAVVALAAALAPSAHGAADPWFSGWRTLGVADGLPADKVLAVAVDGVRVWAGTEAGLALVTQGEVRTWGVPEGLPFAAVTALAVNPRNHDLWVGTMGGLARWSAGRLQAYTQLDSGLVNNVIYGVALNGDEVWIATASGLNRFDPVSGQWAIFDTTNTLMHEPWCYAVTADQGTVYTAVWGSGVLVRDGATGEFRVHRDPDGEMEIDLFRDDGLVHDVTSAVGRGGGVLWVGTYFGLSRYDGRRWRSYSQEDSGLAGNFINFVRATDEAVWIGTDQGLSRFDSETWHTWRREEAGGFSLSVTGEDGRRRQVAVDGGPASNTIYGIDLSGGDVWLATASGLTRAVGRPAASTPAAGRGEATAGGR